MGSEASDNSPELFVQVDDTPELMQLTDIFDEARSNMLDACSDHAQNFSAETAELVTEKRTTMITALCSAVEFIKRDLPEDEALEAICSLFIEEDRDRVSCFNRLTEGDNFKFVSYKKMSRQLEECASQTEDVEEFTELAVNTHIAAMQRSVNAFNSKLDKTYKARGANTYVVTLDNLISSTGELDESTFVFSIQPPIKIHDPKFMGENVTFTFSDKHATYGTITLHDLEPVGDVSTEDYEAIIQERVTDQFNDAINPLGHTALNVVWGDGNF